MSRTKTPTKPSAKSKEYTIHGTTGKSRAHKDARAHQDAFNEKVQRKMGSCVCCMKTPLPRGAYPIGSCCTVIHRNKES